MRLLNASAGDTAANEVRALPEWLTVDAGKGIAAELQGLLWAGRGHKGEGGEFCRSPKEEVVAALAPPRGHQLCSVCSVGPWRIRTVPGTKGSLTDS